jgi:uncharacterized membrane protein
MGREVHFNTFEALTTMSLSKYQKVLDKSIPPFMASITHCGDFALTVYCDFDTFFFSISKFLSVKLFSGMRRVLPNYEGLH